MKIASISALQSAARISDENDGRHGPDRHAVGRVGDDFEYRFSSGIQVMIPEP